MGNPIRPIISSIGTFNYNFAKFLVPILTPLTLYEYTVENTKDFVNDITALKNNEPVVMASVDIQSLFTNVPLEETTNLIVHELLNSKEYPHHLNEKQIKKALQLATVDSVFTFSDNLYTQIDGVAMGSPLGPTYANAFLCHHEKEWLNQCPEEFKPNLYRRYVDDTFLLFKNCSQVEREFIPKQTVLQNPKKISKQETFTVCTGVISCKRLLLYYTSIPWTFKF
ncbi:uncharacterized protein LOC119575548 [Penaeus monodon]|uniref:uncharacterized protein LOC119575548 n=1 Tax=Penaeus monodon TaxID=6687 RepID=UPI0018A79F12|nr:uncharacterized protein LOC119575548 [Penaeus monodon]